MGYTIISLSFAQPQSCHLLYNRQNREGKNKDFASMIISSHVKQRELNNHIARFNLINNHLLLFAFHVDYSHLRDKLITSKLSRDDESSHYTRECNELNNSEIETNLELEEQIKETSKDNIEKPCEGYSKYLPGYR